MKPYRITQTRYDIVSLHDWRLDEEFPFAPQGAKPKRIFICPNPPPYGFLIGGHRYLFKEPEGFREQQLWSEVIAYELSRNLSVDVPPAFLATAPGNGNPGVLVEFFYGRPNDPETRFVHAIDAFQGSGYQINYKRGSLRDAITICRVFGIQDWREWWATTLTFDALIGNTDSHLENWGFLIHLGETRKFSMAPTFDNGTSLGCTIREADLARFTRPYEIARQVAAGCHSFGWLNGDKKGAQHARLCKKYQDFAHPSQRSVNEIIGLTDLDISRTVERFVDFGFPLSFSSARAKFVIEQLRARRDSIAEALG
jgi:hypothetical protein